METNYCMSCGTEQGLVGKQDFYCERCGVLNSKDGWCEEPQDLEQTRDNMDFYDNREKYRDRQDWERNKYDR